MLTLAKIAYCACPSEHKHWHESVLNSRGIQLEECCTTLIGIHPRNKLISINYDVNICAKAAKHGHLDCLSYAHNIGFTYGHKIGKIAAVNGHLDCLQYAREHGYTPNNDKVVLDEDDDTSKLCSAMMVFVHLSTLAVENHNYWFVNAVGKGLSMGYSLTNLAVIANDFNILQLAHQYRCRWDVNNICNLAIRVKNYKAFVYCHINGCKLSMDTCAVAAKIGACDILKYAHQNGCPLEDNTCTVAATFGHCDIVEYAHQNGCTLEDNTCATAAIFGHFDVVKYAHQNGCSLDSNTCTLAASFGYRNILMYAHQNGCPLNNITCTLAANLGYFDIFIYAHQNGCPLDQNTCIFAANGKNINILKYARDNGCLWNDYIRSYVDKLGMLDKL